MSDTIDPTYWNDLGLEAPVPAAASVAQCNVGGCGHASEATITIAGFPLRMCGDHARLIEGALERRQQA